MMLLLAVIFGAMYIAFNLYVEGYVRSGVEEQLAELVHSFGGERQSPERDFYGDIYKQPRSKIGAKGEMILIDSEYEEVADPFGRRRAGDEERAAIVVELKSSRASLGEMRNVDIRTALGSYLVSSVQSRNNPDEYLVFYVSLDGLNHLVQTVNSVIVVLLILAMLLCMLIAMLIAKSVTKPVRQLADFALEVGAGNFQRRELRFADIEFDLLSDAMNQAAEKLEKYDGDQRTFFQNVSHELRTPLQSIRFYAEGLGRGLMESGKSAEVIIGETDRLSEMVEDLLYISRMDMQAEVLAMEPGDLRETLASSAARVAGLNKLDIVYDFDENPVIARYSEKYMERAFVNLLSNAARYAIGRCVLSCKNSDGRAVVSISDDGAGILPEDIPHIFERFYKGRGGKHGIGLSIIKSVVDLHCGRLSVSSTPGYTEFRIEL